MNNSNGNFTAAGTWSLIDSTSLSNTEANSSANTTSWQASVAFVPGAIAIDGLAIKIAAHTAAGTVSVRLGINGSISSNSIANPTVITTPANHGLKTGQAIVIAGSNSTPSINGAFNVTVLSDTTFSIPVNVTVAGSAGTWQTVLSTITGNTNAASTVITSTAHGLSSGQQILIKGSTSSPSLNGTWTITVLSANTFSIPLNTTSGFVSGGGVYNIVGIDDTVVSINTSDLQTVNAVTSNGWAFFKFPSSITLKAGASYTVQITGTTNGVVTAFRSATANDWARALRTTTTQALAAGDTSLVCGDYSSPGTNNTYTVTMDNTSSATSYGPMEIAGKGILAYGISASTNYYLKMGANITGYSGGIYTQGTAASPMPASSTGKLEFVCTSNVQFGFECRTGFTFKTGGNVLTTNTANLAADASASATALTTDVSTGWKSGDVIALAATTRTRAECESKALTGDASGTSLAISALSNAHGGSAPIVAELANLTRNVSIFSTSTVNQTYINIGVASIVDLQSTEFYNMGSATASKRGIDVGITTGSCAINNCSLHDFNVASSVAINCNAAANNNITVSNNVFYNIANVMVNVTAGTTTNMTFNNLLGILSGASCFAFANLSSTITNITAVGATTQGMALAQQASSGVFGTLNNLIAHSNTGPGISFANLTNFGNNPYGLVTNLTSWRNTTFGISLSNTFDFIVDTGTLFGNATANIQYGGSCGNTWVRNMVSNAGTVLTCPVGVQVGNDTKETYVDNCTFGVTTTHATADVQVSATNIYPRVFFRNCIMNSATPVATPGNMIEGGQISSARHQQTAGNHKTWKKFGTTTPDTTIFNKASPSERLTPSSSVQKLFSGYKKVAVPNGQTAVINVFVRKSVAGDGSAYNGNQPRLIQKSDAATGNNSDVVLATATNSANGAFLMLTAQIAAVNDDCVVTFYVDCDGTAGWVNVDDWSVNS